MTRVILNVRAKYGNRRTDGFHSGKEAARFHELKYLERVGRISNLRRQVRYELIPRQEAERGMYYIADFEYRENGQLVVEDVKGCKTPLYIAKRKLMLLVHGIKVRET